MHFNHKESENFSMTPKKSLSIKKNPGSSIFDPGTFSAQGIFLLSLLFLTGCATTAPKVVKTQSPEDIELQGYLAQAVSQFALPDPPKALTLLDQTQAQWNSDKSMKITVHQIWAARIKPNHPFPVLATVNTDSETLTIQSLMLYDLDETGNYVKAQTQPQAQWVSLGENTPPSLSNIVSVHLPELEAGQALDLRYTLETKTSTLLANKDIQKNPSDAKKPHPVPPEGSLAFRWNDFTPSLKRELTIQFPKDLLLYADRLRIPDSLQIEEDKNPAKTKTIHFLLEGPQDPVPSESYQPALQDMVPLTAFTLCKSWNDAVLPYRKRIIHFLGENNTPMDETIQDIVAEAGDNTATPLLDRIARVKSLLHQKVTWVDTGLPIYLNPDRPVSEILDSGQGTSHDMAVLLAMTLKAMKLSPNIYLYRQATSGELLPDLPALSQFDSVLVAVPSGKELIWMDPTEPLAAPNVLPLGALDRLALSVLMPLTWTATPAFASKDHRKHRDVTMQFDDEGNLSCTVDLLAYGSAELALRQFFRSTTDDQRRELVLRGLTKRFPGVSLTDYRFGDYHDLTKPLDVHYAFSIPNYAQFDKQGDMVFYPPVFEDVEDFFTVLQNSRKTPVVIPQNFSSETEAIVKLPNDFKAGDLPKDTTVANSVAEFSSLAKLQFGTLSYERYMGLKQRSIALGKEYDDLMTFYQIVLTQDRTPFKAIPVP
jgi:hypothetical protein